MQTAAEVEVRVNGKAARVAAGTPLGEVLGRLDPQAAARAVAARVDGRLVDLARPVEGDCQVEAVGPETSEGLEVLRHSTAHVLAQAMQRLFPGAKLAIGPPIEDGFYYDFELPRSLTPEDLERLEEEMRRIVAEDLPFSREELDREEALRFFQDRQEPYKVEILEGLDDPRPSLYRQGEFVDLCRGPHVPSTGRLGPFKLRSVAGAYWRGDSRRPMLQRVYGTAFPTQEELDRYLELLAEAARRDHRRLGRELDLFSFREEAPGFLFWHPKGFVLYRLVEEFSRKLQERRGYLEVSTPWILRARLWETSGHWAHYRENMFLIEAEQETMGVKPMNCPAHCLLYKTHPRSYRDLPLRFAEYGPLARLEPSGTLHGALRVRGFHQDDAHLFVREDQIEDEIVSVLELVDEVYRTFGMAYEIYLSTRPEDFMGDPATWEEAEKALEQALRAAGRDFRVTPGEGAFYGPKLDFYATDAIGRRWQLATVQLDFQFPERFDLTYAAPDGSQRRPVMIHRAVLGTIERFLGVLVEHYAGAFPPWLAPVQARVIPVAERHLAYAEQVRAGLAAAGLRVEVDTREEKVGYKIRQAQVEKIPYMLVVGDREAEGGTVSVRHRREGDLGAMPLAAFTRLVQDKVAARSPD